MTKQTPASKAPVEWPEKVKKQDQRLKRAAVTGIAALIITIPLLKSQGKKAKKSEK